MDKSQVVRTLEEITRYLELEDANPFEIAAFRNGTIFLDEWTGDLDDAVQAGTLTDIYGIGKGIAKIVTELVQTGRSEKHDKLKAAYPPRFLELFDVSGLGTKKIRTLHGELGVEDIDSLDEAIRSGRIRTVKGFGAKTEERLLRSIARLRERRSHT